MSSWLWAQGPDQHDIDYGHRRDHYYDRERQQIATCYRLHLTRKNCTGHPSKAVETDDYAKNFPPARVVRSSPRRPVESS